MKKYNCSHSKVQRIVTSENHIHPIDGVIHWHVNEADLSKDMDKYKILFAFEKAFRVWEDLFAKLNIDIKIKSTADKGKAAFVLKFRKNDAKDLPFDFGKRTIAYCMLPTDGDNTDFGADVFLNDAHNFSEMHKPGHINLFKAVVHELGHGFGLYHSKVENDIMEPYYKPNDNVIITHDTEEGILKLYGQYLKKEEVVFTSADLKKIFPTISSIKTMHEESIVALGKMLNVDVDEELLKRKNAEKLYQKLYL